MKKPTIQIFTTGELYSETKRWTIDKANEYLKIFMIENHIQSNWEIENIANYGSKPRYCITMKQPGVKAVRIDFHKDTLKRIINRIHTNKEDYVALLSL